MEKQQKQYKEFLYFFTVPPNVTFYHVCFIILSPFLSSSLCLFHPLSFINLNYLRVSCNHKTQLNS